MNATLGDALIVIAIAVALCVSDCNTKKKCPPCDCSGGTVFVLDHESQLKINRKADSLLIQGDSATGYLLKKVLMSQSQ